MNWILHTLRNSFVYTGRARRAEYGWFFLFGLCLSIGISMIAWAAEVLKLDTLKSLFDVLHTIVVEYLWWIPSISLATRRLHDLGHSGWWQLVLVPLFLFDPILWLTVGGTSNEYVEQFYEMYPIMMMVLGACAIASLCLTLLLLFRDGEKNTNKYGVSPKYSAEQETAVQTL